MMINKTKRMDLQNILDSFESRKDWFDEEEVAITIGKYCIEHKKLPKSTMDIIIPEHKAFNCVSRARHIPDNWNEYFEQRPLDIRGNFIESGKPFEENISIVTIKYWQKRCDTTSNILLRSRYADLIWTFSKELIKSKVCSSYARIAIDTYLEIFRKSLYKDYWEAENRLKRALHLALSINDPKSVRKVRNAFFILFDMAADLSKPGMWDILYRNVYIDHKVPLTSHQVDKIMSSLEEFVYKSTDLRSKKHFKPWAIQSTVMKLVKYYRHIGKIGEAHRIIKRYGAVFVKFVSGADSHFALHWLQQVYDLYRSEGLKREAKSIQILLKEVGKKATISFKKIETSMFIKQKEINAYLKMMMMGDFRKSFDRLILKFIPRVKIAISSLKEKSQKYPLLVFFRHTKMSDNQIVSNVDSLNEDLEGQILSEVAQDISLHSWQLEIVFDKLVEKYKVNAKKLIDIFDKSPIFDIEHYEMFKYGVEYYLKKEWLAAIHILIPQIEYILRYLLGLLGEPVSKPGRKPGTMQEKNLNDILAEPVIKKFLPLDLLTYYKAFLSDKRGHNLRNRLSHGLLKSGEHLRFHADRVMHILFTLTLVRSKEPVKS